ncbi:hypothetical protein [Chryseobacterium sp. JAH]|uniref:hypothetical protein n=1 Tax=Chryseobacterium sp. JAH TaxID=1742858 RepID=UPI000740EA77|nr:hypothetical protein [Chryseobacterium sp. JAH]KUJ50381.1 hypothetical protein AR685_15670 [Chryseobacterium sp. JAH]
MRETSDLTQSQIKDWWRERRTEYNVGLAVSGMLAFILYVISGVRLIMPYDDEFEITLFTIVFQAVGYLFMIGVANLFYFFGVLYDLTYNKDNTSQFRKKLFKLGFWISVSIPFLAPLIIVISYFLNYY